MKKLSTIALAVGGVFVAVGFSLPVVFEHSEWLARALQSIYFFMDFTRFACWLFGGTTVFFGFIGLIFDKQISKRCSLKSIGLALGISALTALGLHCVLSFASCYFLTHPDNHPIRHPVSFIVGSVCFWVFLALFCVYIKLRQKEPSALGVLLDVLLGLGYLPAFGAMCMVADEIVSGWI